MPYVFVYGSLRQGEAAHGLLTGGRYVGKIRTLPCYELMNLGPYPGLVEGGGTAVVGELYEIDAQAWPALDAYEDCPRLFFRAPVALQGGTVALQGGTAALNEGLVAEGYFVRRERLAPRIQAIPSGDWKARDKR